MNPLPSHWASNQAAKFVCLFQWAAIPVRYCQSAGTFIEA